MSLVGTIEDVADPDGEFVSTERPLGLNDLAFAVGIHCGSMGLSHGLFVGSRQGTIRTPPSPPLLLTRRLWEAIQSLTNPDLCQDALSQTRSKASLPAAASFSQHHPRNCVVIELTGRPSTNLIQVRPNSGTNSP